MKEAKVKKRISRRTMLQLSAVTAAGAALAACGATVEPTRVPTATVPPTTAPKAAATAAPVPPTAAPSVGAPTTKESPKLAELVKSGKLPPLTERLPKEPQVITPLKSVGKYGGTIRRYATALDGVTYMMMHGHALVQWTDGGLGIRDGLAKKWEMNKDATEMTFYLREGTKWSDGQPCTVDDILFWWEDIAQNKEKGEVPPAWAKAAGKLMTVEKVDNYTVKWKFAAPNPLLDGMLCRRTGHDPTTRHIAPAHYLKQFHPKYNKDVKDFTTFRSKEYLYLNPELPVLTPWMPVQLVPGDRIILERNPYYFGVDTSGNQLPYVDRVETYYAQNVEMIKTKIVSGEVDFICQQSSLALSDISMLKDNEKVGNYNTLLWDGGSGTGAMVFANQNHPDPERQKIYQDKRFLRALSFALNRPKIQKTIYFGMGEPTTGTLSQKAIEYHRTEKGKQIYKQWRDLAVAYDPAQAKKLLDEVGVVDKNNDGWRELPSGAPLKLRIDQASNASDEYTGANVLIKESWEAVGLQTIINPVPTEQMTAMEQTGTYDIHDSWEVGDGPNHWIAPNWLIPAEYQRWAPLYGRWYQIKGTSAEGQELDKAPRDRNPPREKPPEGSPYERLQNILIKALLEPDEAKRDELCYEAIQIHIDNGPFFIGTVGNIPRVIIAKKTLRNVPTREDMPSGGFVNPWSVSYPAITRPEQYYFE